MSEEQRAMNGTDELPSGVDLKNFLQALFEKMALDVTVETQVDGDQLHVDLTGKGAALFVEGTGATAKSDGLGALGVLLKGVLGQSPYKILLDANGYRKTRQETMMSVADTLARWVSSSGKAVYVTGMNAVDRRGVHAHLKGRTGLKTESVGTGKKRELLVSSSENRPSPQDQKRRSGQQKKSGGEVAE